MRERGTVASSGCVVTRVRLSAQANVSVVTVCERDSGPPDPRCDIGASPLRKLGFTVSVYSGGDFYGYACRGGVSLHLARVDNVYPKMTLVSAYLNVADADALHGEWSTAGVEGRIHELTDTDDGLREGADVDPDGNLLRYGSPLASPDESGE